MIVCFVFSSTTRSSGAHVGGFIATKGGVSDVHPGLARLTTYLTESSYT